MRRDDEPLSEREIKILLTKAEKDPYYVFTNVDCHTSQFCTRFFAVCNEVMFNTPSKALEQAFVARRLARETRDSHVISKATSMLGAGYRIEALYEKAEECINEAKMLAKGCACCLAEIHRRHGLILAHQLRFDEAYAAWSDSKKYYGQVNDTNGVARVLIHRGTVLDAMGRHAEALADERKGLTLFSGKAPSRYYIAGMVNTAAILTNFRQQYDEALTCLVVVRESIKGQKGKYERVRVILRWIEGLIFAKIGRRRLAFKRLFSARNGIRRLGLRSEFIALSADISKLFKIDTPRTNDDQVIEIATVCLKEGQPTAKERRLLEELCIVPEVDVIDRLRRAASCQVPALL